MLKSNNLMKKALNSFQLYNFIWFGISNVSDIKNFFQFVRCFFDEKNNYLFFN